MTLLANGHVAIERYKWIKCNANWLNYAQCNEFYVTLPLSKTQSPKGNSSASNYTCGTRQPCLLAHRISETNRHWNIQLDRRAMCCPLTALTSFAIWFGSWKSAVNIATHALWRPTIGCIEVIKLSAETLRVLSNSHLSVAKSYS